VVDIVASKKPNNGHNGNGFYKEHFLTFTHEQVEALLQEVAEKELLTKEELALVQRFSWNDLNDKPANIGSGDVNTSELSSKLTALEQRLNSEANLIKQLNSQIALLDASKANKTDIPSINNLATKDDIENMALKSDIPDVSKFQTLTDVKSLIAQAQLEQGNVDLSNYVTKQELNNEADRAMQEEIQLQNEIDELKDSKANIKHNHEIFDIIGLEGILNNKLEAEDVADFIKEIPEEYITESELAAEGFIKEHQSLEGLATEDFVIQKISQAVFDGEVDLSDYATKAFVNEGIANAIEDNKVDISHLATKDELNEKADSDHGHELEQVNGLLELVNNIPVPKKTSELINDSGFITEHQSLDGLATEDFVKEEIAKAQLENEEVNLDAYATIEFVNEEINKIELTPGPQGPQGIQGPQGTFDPNTIFSSLLTNEKTIVNAINELYRKIQELQNNQPVDPEEPAVPRMWYGLIPYDPEGKAGFNTPEQIGEQMTYDVIKFGLDCGRLTEADPAPLSAEGINIFIDTDYAYCFICVIVPEDSNLVAYMNDGIGGRCEFSKFDTVSGWAQDGCILVNEIDGIKYKLYGMYETSGGGNYGLFIDER
jgi:hypothetical protein